MEILNMNLINILEFNGWCASGRVQQAFHLIKVLLNTMRIIVPMALIVMTVFDILKKVINPDDKDGQKKIMTRALAAIIVFFIPTFISFLFRIIDYAKNNGNKSTIDEYRSSLYDCWAGNNIGEDS